MLSIDFVKISSSIYRQVNISESGSIYRFIDSAILGVWPIALRLFIVHVINYIIVIGVCRRYIIHIAQDAIKHKDIYTQIITMLFPAASKRLWKVTQSSEYARRYLVIQSAQPLVAMRITVPGTWSRTWVKYIVNI